MTQPLRRDGNETEANNSLPSALADGKWRDGGEEDCVAEIICPFVETNGNEGELNIIAVCFSWRCFSGNGWKTKNWKSTKQRRNHNVLCKNLGSHCIFNQKQRTIFECGSSRTCNKAHNRKLQRKRNISAGNWWLFGAHSLLDIIEQWAKHFKCSTVNKRQIIELDK